MWDTETEEQPPEYMVKAHLVLEGSSERTWGVVKDCHGCINYIPEDAEVVGTWGKYGDGEYWVSLETPIQALVDKATLLFVELAKGRQVPARRSKARILKTPEPSAFDSIRKKLKEG